FLRSHLPLVYFHRGRFLGLFSHKNHRTSRSDRSPEACLAPWPPPLSHRYFLLGWLHPSLAGHAVDGCAESHCFGLSLCGFALLLLQTTRVLRHLRWPPPRLLGAHDLGSHS